MYHSIVRKKVVAIFSAVSSGDAEPVISGFATEFEHKFLGDHALGGSRHSLAATRLWYERLYRLLPDISFAIHAVDVRGFPWNTSVVVEWEETNSGVDGVQTSAKGIHLVNLKWGKMTRLLILPDTQILCSTLTRLSEHGIEEANADPISDNK